MQKSFELSLAQANQRLHEYEKNIDYNSKSNDNYPSRSVFAKYSLNIRYFVRGSIKYIDRRHTGVVVKILGVVAIALGLGSVTAPALAHHSAAMFDPAKVVNVTGTVKEFQYTSPHSWLQIVVRQPGGQTALWSFEAENPSQLIRAGILSSTFKPGDRVTVKAHPMRDGRFAGEMMAVTMPDGTVITPSPKPQKS